ncbi:MAG: PAS domain-containing protein [Ignavibacteriae bacterium]|nr:PAS domain-containing protein [Ignavibacteriota bacterium]
MKFSRLRFDLRVALLYMVFGGLWILFSDRIMSDLAADKSTLTTLQTYKGWAFVLASGLMIYLLLRRDIVERKKIDLRLSLALSATRTGVWEWDTKTNAVFWSPECYDIVGMDRSTEKTLGSFLQLIHPDDVGRVKAAFELSLSTRKLFAEDFRIVRPGGDVLWLHNVGKAEYDENGRPLRLTGTMQDITKRKHAEQELQRSEEAIRVSRERLRALSGHLQQVREEERTAIAREVHDELGQQLTALKMDLALLQKRLRSNTDAIEKLKPILAHVDHAIQTVRRIATALRPSILDDFGLIAALEWQANEFQRRTGITCAFESDVEQAALDNAGSTALFRIFQESLTNVVRHSEATHVLSRLHQSEHDVTLEIIDNGKGMGTHVGVGGLGILGMRERAELLGGALDIQEPTGGGVTVMVKIPQHAKGRS